VRDQVSCARRGTRSRRWLRNVPVRQLTSVLLPETDWGRAVLRARPPDVEIDAFEATKLKRLLIFVP